MLTGSSGKQPVAQPLNVRLGVPICSYRTVRSTPYSVLNPPFLPSSHSPHSPRLVCLARPLTISRLGKSMYSGTVIRWTDLPSSLSGVPHPYGKYLCLNWVCSLSGYNRRAMDLEKAASHLPMHQVVIESIIFSEIWLSLLQWA